MKYFDFDTINQQYKMFMAGNIDRYGQYFDFKKLNELGDYVNDWILFFIISFLVYLWIKLFLEYDKL